MLFICDTVVRILFTNFFVTSACSSLSTSLSKSITGSGIDNGCDDLFFVVFLNYGVKVIIGFLSFLYFVVVCISGISFSHLSFFSCKASFFIFLFGNLRIILH